MSALAWAGVYSSAVLSSATTAYAVVPSCEIWLAPPSPKGLATPVTWGSAATSAKMSSARVADRGRGEAVLGVENDLHGVAGLLRELGLQCLRGGL